MPTNVNSCPKFFYKEITQNNLRVCQLRNESVYLFPLIFVAILTLLNYFFFKIIQIYYISIGLTLTFLSLYVISLLYQNNKVMTKLENSTEKIKNQL